MRKPTRIDIAAAVLAFGASFTFQMYASAMSEEDFCPSTLHVVTQVIGVPKDWQTADPSAGRPLVRRSVAFYSGPFADGLELKPQRIERSFKKGVEAFVHQYVFSDPAQKGVSIVCRYANTTLVMHRVLATTPRTCTVRFTNRPAPGDTAKVSCDESRKAEPWTGSAE